MFGRLHKSKEVNNKDKVTALNLQLKKEQEKISQLQSKLMIASNEGAFAQDKKVAKSKAKEAKNARQSIARSEKKMRQIHKKMNKDEPAQALQMQQMEQSLQELKLREMKMKEYMVPTETPSESH